MRTVLVAAGPLTALLNPNDEWHAWARDTMRRLPAPLLTSEPVLTEVPLLLRREGCDFEGTRIQKGRVITANYANGREFSPAGAAGAIPGSLLSL